MATTIRLQRTGKLNQPSYRLAVFDVHTRRQGRAIEFIGLYDPRNKDAKQQLSVNVERAIHWQKQGAILTETVQSLFKKTGAIWASGSTREERKRAKSKAIRKARAQANKASGGAKGGARKKAKAKVRKPKAKKAVAEAK